MAFDGGRPSAALVLYRTSFTGQAAQSGSSRQKFSAPVFSMASWGYSTSILDVHGHHPWNGERRSFHEEKTHGHTVATLSAVACCQCSS